MSREQQKELIKGKIKSLLAKGFTQNEIALQLEIGVSTVKRHISNLKKEGLL